VSAPKHTPFMPKDEIRKLDKPFFVQHETSSGTQIYIRVPENGTDFVEYKMWAGLQPIFSEQWTQFPPPAYRDAVKGAAERLVACGNACEGIADPSAVPELLAALKGVLAVADRKTKEFDAARAAIARAEGRK
jgi:hypothetical protein